MRNNTDTDDTNELYTDLKRIEEKIEAIIQRLNAGISPQKQAPLSPLGERIRRELERHADQPDRSFGARWLSRLIGIDRDLIEPELNRLCAEGALYSRPFYGGLLYYRCGHGPAVRARRAGKKPADLPALTDAIGRVVTGGRFTSQTGVEEAVRREVKDFNRREFWSAWSDLRHAKRLVKRDDGVYVIV
jgi:hypothetical protein